MQRIMFPDGMDQSRYTVRRGDSPPHRIFGCFGGCQTEAGIKTPFWPKPTRHEVEKSRKKYSRNSQTFGTRTVLPVLAFIGSHNNKKKKLEPPKSGWHGKKGTSKPIL